MRILWDFRLFSHGYRDRGVGTFCCAMVHAIKEEYAGRAYADTDEIFIWGNRSDVPADCAAYAAQWIPYKPAAWKSDLFVIPFLIMKHRIRLIHYWIAMGPVFRIGMGLFHPCATCMTVYDLGVEYLKNDAFCSHVRQTKYWRIQKMLLHGADSVVCISQKTKEEVQAFTQGKLRRCEVIYMAVLPRIALSAPLRDSAKRMRMFVALGGAPHKNVTGVVQAFSMFIQSHPGFCLVILGNGDLQPPQCDSVFFEGMDRYGYYLDNAAGLVACSTYEGLGIPPLEAMSRGCPLVVSDMPVFHETCGGTGARFVEPRSPAAIAEGMCDVADHQEEWVKKSKQGFERYMKMSENAGKQWVELYKSLSESRMKKITQMTRKRN
jgi:glycosyltransferase involved in cell wall biosynthesis